MQLERAVRVDRLLRCRAELARQLGDVFAPLLLGFDDPIAPHREKAWKLEIRIAHGVYWLRGLRRVGPIRLHGCRTARPRMRPSLRSARASPAAASGRVVSGRAGSVPDRAIRISSCISARLPTYEPMMLTAFIATIAGATGVAPPNNPTDISLPAFRNTPIPNANVDAAPTKSIAAATPPPVAFISAFCAPSAVGSMTSPAPASRAM